MSPHILAVSGLKFNLQEPDADLIEIEDIAHALSHICRFTGHTRTFYSVAEHCWRASFLVPHEHALEALLHDAAEAYIGDVSSPLKALLPDYRAIEHGVERAIRERFGLPAKPSACIKQADLMMLATEKRDLMPHDQEPWEILDGIEPQTFPLTPPFSSEYARRFYLSRFHDLSSSRNTSTN